MSTTRPQEVLVCFGKKKQTDIATAQTAADMWRFSKINAALANPKLATENDADATPLYTAARSPPRIVIS